MVISGKLKKALLKRTHPEQEKDEIFLFNAFKKQVDLLDWDELRLGQLIEETGMFPVFIKKLEFTQRCEVSDA